MVGGRAVVRVVCHVLLWCIVDCGMAVCEGGRSLVCLVCLVFLFLLFFFVLVFGVVRAQLCEHARCPRTPLCFSWSVSCFLFFSSLRLSSSFFVPRLFSACLEWRGGSPCVRVFGGHDCDG